MRTPEIFTHHLMPLSAALTFAAVLAATPRAQADPPTTPTAPAAPVAIVPAAPDAALALAGKAAPDFTLPDQNDKTHSLKNNRGKWVVVAFYPADMTKGCTFQNISYTRTSDKFAALNAVVYTVSTQDTASKKQFCAKDSLTHTLLADVGGKNRRRVQSAAWPRRPPCHVLHRARRHDCRCRRQNQRQQGGRRFPRTPDEVGAAAAHQRRHPNRRRPDDGACAPIIRTFPFWRNRP